MFARAWLQVLEAWEAECYLMATSCVRPHGSNMEGTSMMSAAA